MIAIESEGIIIVPIIFFPIDEKGEIVKEKGQSYKYAILLTTPGSPGIIPIICDTIEELRDAIAKASKDGPELFTEPEPDDNDTNKFLRECATATVSIIGSNMGLDKMGEPIEPNVQKRIRKN